MKNKKIIPMTIAMVAVVLVGMLVLSKFFETSWQRPEQVDNSLNVDSNKLDEPSNFDYPYLDYVSLCNSTDEAVRSRYSQVIDAFYMMYKNDRLTADTDTGITPQQVANICGEYFKYALGVTEQSTFPAIVMFWESDVDYAQSSFYYLYFSDRGFSLSAYLDPSTGNIIEMSSSGPILFEMKEGLDYSWTIESPTDEACATLESDTKEILSMAEIKPDIEITGMDYLYVGSEKSVGSDPVSGYYVYYVEVKYADGDCLLFRYISVDKTAFQFERMEHRQFEVFDKLRAKEENS